MITTKNPVRRLLPLTAAFAAVYGVLRLIPISVWIGASTRVFTATEFFAPLLGTVLGPYAGSVAAAIGTFLGIALTGRMNFFGLDFLPIMVNALVLGFLVRERRIASFLLYSGLLALYFVHPSTLHFISVPLPNAPVLVPFVWLHIGVWLLLASPVATRSAEWAFGRSASVAAIGTFVLVLIGGTAQHLAGTLLFASMAVPLMGLTPKALQTTWTVVFYVYPVERLVVALAATIVTLSTIRVLRVSRLLDVLRAPEPGHDTESAGETNANPI